MVATEEIARLQEMLAAGAGAQADLARQLADHPDPTVRLLAEMWSRRGAEEVEADETPIPAQPAVEAIDLDTLGLPGTGLRSLRRHVERLELELERLQEINDTLAAALGACALCWGDDPECEECRGHGGPGSQLPARDLFGSLVVPALRRLRGTDAAAAVPRSRPLPPSQPMRDRATTDERRQG